VAFGENDAWLQPASPSLSAIAVFRPELQILSIGDNPIKAKLQVTARPFFSIRTKVRFQIARVLCTQAIMISARFSVLDSGALSMVRRPILSLFLALSAGAQSAQIPISQANVEIDTAGVFPIDGSTATVYSTGPGLRVGGDFRLHRNLVAEGGWIGAWMGPIYYNCSSSGCSYSRLENKFLDYGLRGVLPLAGGRVELSLGVGGGYIWFDSASGDNNYYNGSLFQYSGKAAVALDRNGHWRVNFTVRTWRDLGRPIQQWLSTAAGISYGFGTVR
jgi:hypothetical protein